MLTVFPRVRAGKAPEPICYPCVGANIYAQVLDQPASASYSRGIVQVGYDPGTGTTWTGSASKSTGSVSSPGFVYGGTSSGGTTCDDGILYIEAREPTNSLPGPENFFTRITVYVAGSLVATVDGNYGNSGLGNVTQTITFTRNTADQIDIFFDSVGI